MSSNDIRIGLAGLGSRGLYWLDLLKMVPGFKVVALCDAVPALLDKGLAHLGDRLPHEGAKSPQVHRKLFETDPSTKRLTVLRSALQMQTPEQMPFSTQPYFEELIPAGTGVAGTTGLLAGAGVGRCT